MPNYRAEARRAALRYGLDPRVFSRQISAESGFNPGAVSPAGAIGIAQIMPATARGWGVNPRDPVAALNAAAKNMASYVKRYGSYRNALVAYNAGPGRVGGPLPAETRAYIAKILGGGAGPHGLAAPGGSQHVNGVQQAIARVSAGAVPGSSVPEGSSGILGLLQALGGQKQAPSSMGLASPAFSAQAALPAAYKGLSSGGGPGPKPDVSGLLAAIQTAGGSVAHSGIPGASAALGGGVPTQVAGGAVQAAGGGRLGKVTIRPGADRAGVRTSSTVLNFIRRVAGLYGGPLVIGTGSNHSKMTVNGNVSDHWGGNAADVPLTGRALVRAGQDALIAAGWAPARARRATGGLYNVTLPGGRRVQIIFNTHVGGDHTNHLHVGISRR